MTKAPHQNNKRKEHTGRSMTKRKILLIVTHVNEKIKETYIWVENISADSKIGQKKNFSNLEA